MTWERTDAAGWRVENHHGALDAYEFFIRRSKADSLTNSVP